VVTGALSNELCENTSFPSSSTCSCYQVAPKLAAPVMSSPERCVSLSTTVDQRTMETVILEALYLLAECALGCYGGIKA
jgi:hypothetical protein